ncbi:uncharacterized protein HD556DRAFT_1440148 [Suillus plorans]|uniref:DUF6533 domain-containing protein n=1 Tax=Suillus plorans TaxID=116603 RepID=A0A9P7J0N4_9AGAM|nr:uncharacterized protein HD556DRAFT_1440148 [Suillus plorans]KAG1798442.1 hypothetical protein HD556DRAFT_1440148 [Suillus plorans]
MTKISDDPSWWSFIDDHDFYSYWRVAAGFVVVYDWALTLGQEIELIWGQRWSLITVLFLVVHTLYWNAIFCYRRSGIYPNILADRRSLSGYLMTYAKNGQDVIVFVMLGIIMIARLHAMYQGSRMMLIFLVIIFLAINIACAVIINIVEIKDTTAEELILSGRHMCRYEYKGDYQFLFQMNWILITIWEILALCLSAWIAVKHFRDLQRFGPSTGSIIGDCFRVLIESHVLYFASFVGVPIIEFILESSEVEHSNSMASSILHGAYQILSGVQWFVLGPRLVLGVREYHAKLVAESDAETSMNSIVFQEHVYVPTSSSV